MYKETLDELLKIARTVKPVMIGGKPYYSIEFDSLYNELATLFEDMEDWPYADLMDEYHQLEEEASELYADKMELEDQIAELEEKLRKLQEDYNKLEDEKERVVLVWDKQ